MSSGGQLAGGLIGGIAGAFIGGPAGAYQGAALGMAIGGALDPPKGPSREGPRLNDLSIQTSTYGAVIPRIYGTVGGMNGNIFWLENNKLKEVATETEEGGKGGGSTSEVTTYSYFATASIGICEGEIGGVRRIWAGTNLIYDAGSSDVDTIKQSNRQIEGFDVYTGSETQTASSRMQADLGAGNVSAYRGLSYVVIKDFPVEIYGNAMPPFKFEVVGIDGSTVEKIQETAITENQNPYVFSNGNPMYRGGFASQSDSEVNVLLPNNNIQSYPVNTLFDGLNSAQVSLLSQTSNNSVISNYFQGKTVRSYPMDGLGAADPSFTHITTSTSFSNSNYIISVCLDGGSYVALVLSPDDTLEQVVEFGQMVDRAITPNTATVSFNTVDKGYGRAYAMARDGDTLFLLLNQDTRIAVTELNGDLIRYIDSPEIINRSKDANSMRFIGDKLCIYNEYQGNTLRFVSYDLSGNLVDDFFFDANI